MTTDLPLVTSSKSKKRKKSDNGIPQWTIFSLFFITTLVVVSLVKALIVMFVFVNILYSTGFDPIGGIVDLVESFLDGGFSGLLALLIFVSFAG